MKIALLTDAWLPQVNGVVTTLQELVQQLQACGHAVQVLHPGQFATRPCPGYAGIDLAMRPGKRVAEMLDALRPDAIHLATEGPLGWAGRRYCLRRNLAFTTAFHTRFPEILDAALRVPLAWGYAVLRHFHRPSSAVMVPTHGVLQMLAQRGFRNLRQWTHGVDTQAFVFHGEIRPGPLTDALAHPVSLFVGRVSYEKNIEAFLRLDLPGTKVVCGVGPLQARLAAKYPQVRWLGILDRAALAQVYAAADVFVFPSRSETFGLVMLEAMACGTPVAAFPEDGPMEVLGAHTGQAPRGGALHEDLLTASREALAIPRSEARNRALDFTWARTARLFQEYLVPARAAHDTP
ncbi:glycosyltransferase family 1 protein [Verminephrobacter aporrectodeae subsp. tuberculatae]|uniref:glycosyltransferase family 4 protein n=1 Tax=Verminephrobacter aporrectodeae TaxID=1110389 RepID=UPI0022432874|nr:glycosyltransferase family 1 protein [Verminephrobacter aporrectodeae]MCW8205615.1 glycosyltransferase family 1 protein [Verminephrobacter aporrectodeae subsp. tuberculatae]